MKPILSLVILASFLFSVSLVAAQIINVGNRIENKVIDRTNNHIDQGIDKGLDAIEDEVTGTNNKKDKTKKNTTEKAKSTNTETNELTENPAPEEAKASPQDKPSMQTYSKYDFIPGEKVLFYDDFTETAVGDFPPNWNTDASGEVVTTNLFPGNWFKMIGEGSIALDEGMKLPDNYTIEFEVVPVASGKDFDNFDFGFYLYNAVNPKDMNEGGAVPGTGGIKMTFGYKSSYSAYDENGYTINGDKEDAAMEADKKYRLSFWVQKTRLRVYFDQTKIFDLPKVFAAGFHCNMMRFELWMLALPWLPISG